MFYIYRAQVIAHHDFGSVRHDTYHASEALACQAAYDALAKLDDDPEWSRSWESKVSRIDVNIG